MKYERGRKSEIMRDGEKVREGEGQLKQILKKSRGQTGRGVKR